MAEVKKKNWLVVIGVLLIMLVPSLGVFLILDKPWKKMDPHRPTPPPVLSLDSLPSFHFTAQNGDTINRDSVSNSIVIVDYFYTRCPGICAQLSASMERIQDFIKKNEGFQSKIRLLSHSVDPTNDSVPVLKKYAAAHHADDRMWWLMTGDKKEIYDIGINFYKLPVQQITNDSGAKEPFIHSERLVLLDKKGYIRGYYDGTDSTKVKQLLNDLVTLDIDYAIQQGVDEKKVTKGSPKSNAVSMPDGAK